MDALRSGWPASMALALLSLVAFGCERLELSEPEPASRDEDAEPESPTPDVGAEPPDEAPRRRVDSRPPPMAQPVPLWREGASERNVDAATADVHGYLVLDLGESWTPYLFTERSGADEEPVEHAYRDTYLALARGEFPDDHHGARAERDKYLELYGIMPTLGLLRERFRRVRDLECREALDLTALEEFDGFIAYRHNRVARRRARHFRYLESQVDDWLEAQGVDDVEQLDEERLNARERRALREYRELRPRVRAIRAAQDRLECEGYFEGKGEHVRGALDWATHEALAEFERRHRVYGWGFIGRETLVRLRQTPMELEREAVVRVLTERAMHALGVIEDGSAPGPGDGPPTFRGRDGVEHEVPNLEAALRERVVEALGLTSPEATLDFLEGLGELTPDSERLVAIDAPELPEYYDEDMDIRIEIDRGDVWYEFPYDAEGNERAQPVQRRPRLTVFVHYADQRIPLARFGTTIGGWRSEEIDGRIWWKYKNSPTGPRIWHQIVSAPVWMPPASTPARDLLDRVPRRSGADAYRVDYHETGPSYASAYGLVAAYHRLYSRREDGTIDVRGDEGIRTHGSVDYMSIMRRHSHGCHRLHNHIAVRLMSWVLAHRHHTRVGHQATSFHRNIEHEGHTYELDIDRGGYVFDLERPVPIRVLEGRIRGNRATPVEHPLPQYDDDRGAYLLPDGGPVRISRHGQMTRYEMDAGAPDGGVPDGGVPDAGLQIVDPYAASE
jgi:hypothetical protein